MRQHGLSFPHVVVYRRKPSLLAMYTQQLPVLPDTLPVISWPSLNKAVPSFQSAADLTRSAAD